MDALRQAAAAADAAEEALWEAARTARAAGIPVDLVAALAHRGRATVYRQLDRRADDATPGADPAD